MQLKLPFDITKPLVGEASIEIDQPIQQVFSYIGEKFFHHYPKWALEVIEFEPLNGTEVFVGATAKQIRQDNGVKEESIFSITDYQPHSTLSFQGINAPYKHCYVLTTDNPQLTRLTLRFELLELEVFMRPFSKLIRIAIEEGIENTVVNIKNLIVTECH